MRLYAFFMGVICIILGGVPLLGSVGIRTVDSAVFNPLVIKVVLMLGGFFLLYYALRTYKLSRHVLLAIATGFLMAIVGVMPLLVDYKILGFFPFVATLSIPVQVLEALLVFYGFFLLYDAFFLREPKTSLVR